MAPGHRLKRESAQGLPTPNLSTCATATPKLEDDYESPYVSDSIEVVTPTASFSGHNGLPFNGYGDSFDQSRRSNSVSVRTSRPPRGSQSRRPEQMASPASEPAGFELVGKNVKILVDAIKDLREIGLGEQVVQLPELVLVGDQSAGKSSLMSALTGIQLPRDQGTCTRCPANITTSPAEMWSCKISLQESYSFTTENRRVTKANGDRPFGPWTLQHNMATKNFKTIYQKEELEENIRWAQVALLNPSTPHTQFIPGSGYLAVGRRTEDQNETKFTPNVIAVDISGPDLPTLSFFDLPGLVINMPREEDEHFAKVVENLATKYIQRENALVIWTLAMKTEPHNSQTGKLIRNTLRAGHRTIGVLTNPDHVRAFNKSYDPVLRGIDFKVGHGFFVTRQPGEEIDLSGPSFHAEARRLEREYFDNSELWNDQWKDFLPRCGTDVIQNYLSVALAKQIMSSLPVIQRKIDNETRDCQNDLDQIPDLPNTNVKTEISKCLMRFTTDIRDMVTGNDAEDFGESFKGSWSNITREFKALLLHVKPKIVVTHRTDMLDARQSSTIDLTGDDTDESHPPSPELFFKRPRTSFNDSPLKRPQFTQSRSVTPSTPAMPYRSTPKQENGLMSAPPKRRQTPNAKFINSPYASLSRAGSNFMNLQELTVLIQRHSRPGMHSITSTTAYNEICLKTTIPWQSMLNIFMEQTFTMVRRLVHAKLRTHLIIYEKRELFREAKRHLDEFLDTEEMSQRAALQEIFNMENHRAYTENKEAHDRFEKEELDGLKKARRDARVHAHLMKQWRADPKKKPNSMSELTGEEKRLEFERLGKSVKDSDLGPDKFDQELQVAAHARAYYLVAGMRFLDHLCLSVNGRLFWRLNTVLCGDMYLQTALGIDRDDGEIICRTLMEEDPSLALRRAALITKKNKLLGFSQRLKQLVRQIESSQPSPLPVGNADADGLYVGNGVGEPLYHSPQMTEDGYVDVDMEGVSDGITRGESGVGGFPPMTAVDGGH